MKYFLTIAALACIMFSCGGRGGSAKRASNGSVNPAPWRKVAEDANIGTNPDPDTDAASAKPDDGAKAKHAAEPPAPKDYTYRIVNELPHDTGAYTQGLFWHDGHLYEGTGREGHSELRKIDHSTGRAVQRTKLDRKYFGEGIAMLDGLIYQLTWTEGKAFVYDADNFRQIRSFSYDGEGWGLATDGRKLYMSDGSENIYVRNPETFALERTITVAYRGRYLFNLNELEWINGEIWANIYTRSDVARIDPATGRVTGMIDFSGIQTPADRRPQDDVLNGIAYDPVTGNIFVTGKLWNKIYQVEILEK